MFQSIDTALASTMTRGVAMNKPNVRLLQLLQQRVHGKRATTLRTPPCGVIMVVIARATETAARFSSRPRPQCADGDSAAGATWPQAQLSGHLNCALESRLCCAYPYASIQYTKLYNYLLE